MAGKVQPIPEGYRSVTPYLIVKGAVRAIEFYKRALGAKELMRLDGPGGRIGHAEIKIGDSVIMLADESPQSGAYAPQSPERQAVSLLIYVRDVDATFQRAIEAGARQVEAVQDKFYGDRMGGFTDPFGHTWYVATHIEDVPLDELKRRAQAATEKASG
jgi:PhnB protein